MEGRRVEAVKPVIRVPERWNSSVLYLEKKSRRNQELFPRDKKLEKKMKELE